MSLLRTMCFWREQSRNAKSDTPVPSALDLPDGALVIVDDNGEVLTGIFRGAAPDGSYSVRLDRGGLLRAYEKVRLPN